MQTSGTAYYNEIDRNAAAWLRELIEARAIAPGVVDERDLRDVTPADLRGFKQCHFFAGIGVWSYALRLAGWPDDSQVWTGSCPCQPFSTAGKGAGFADERHLWPYWHHLIRVCRPGVVFGEQVASADGLAWLDLVQTDLEGENYAPRAIDCCAAGLGAPHIRQRLWFVANTDLQRRKERRATRTHGTCRSGHPHTLANANGRTLERSEEQSRVTDSGQRSEAQVPDRSRRCRSPYRLGNSISQRLEGLPRDGNGETRWPEPTGYATEASNAHELGDGTGERCEELRNASPARESRHADGPGLSDRPGPTNGYWNDADWLRCRDGRWRAVEPGAFPLVNGASARVGRLRGYGNAINAETAAAIIRAAMPGLN